MKKAIFLDRDGTLIRDQHYGCDPNAIDLLDGVVKGLKRLKDAGYLLVVATNQSGVARAFFTEEQLQEMHHRLGKLLEQQGVQIDAFYYCPHHPEGVLPQYSFHCDCRKPREGMVLKACADFAIDPTASWFVGDILDDVEAGHRAGCRSILLDLGTEAPPETRERVPDFVAADFEEAVCRILTVSPLQPRRFVAPTMKAGSWSPRESAEPRFSHSRSLVSAPRRLGDTRTGRHGERSYG